MTIVLLVNFCPFYRVGIFTKLQQKLNVKIVLFAIEKEKNWEKKNPIYFLHDFHVLHSRNFIETGIDIFKFLRERNPRIIIKSIDGKTAVILSFLYAKITRKPFILWTGVWYLPKGLYGGVRRTFLSLIYRFSDALVVYGKHVSKHLRSFGVREEKIFIAWNATNNHFYSKKTDKVLIPNKRKHLFELENPIILYVGRLESHKGIGDLVNIMPSNPHLNFLIIGDGTFRKEVQRIAICNQHITYLGYRSKEELITYYSLSDCLILPSKTEKTFREPWGLVVNEAMLQKKAIIASNAVGAAIGGLVIQGINGYVYEEGNLQQLNLILKMLNKKQLTRMGEKSWELIQGFDYQTMFEGFKQAIFYVCGFPPKE